MGLLSIHDVSDLLTFPLAPPAGQTCKIPDGFV